MYCMKSFNSILMFNAVQSRALSSLRGLGIRGQRRNSREFDLNSCESRPAIATATRDQRTRHNALLQPKHIWRPGVGDHPALLDIAARISATSILQRLTDRRLFIIGRSPCAQRWQPSQRHFCDPPHWIEQEDQVVGRPKGTPEARHGSRAPLEGRGGR